ncbi:MAG: magnesium transporter, partial [FCB group bacterium]|nr:magnesium transporter [FCB group bacterium]
MLKLTLDLIIELLENGQQDELREKINLLHPADAAQIINELPAEYQVKAFSYLSPELASDVLYDLHDELREDVLETIQQKRLVEIMDEMDSDEATDIAAELDEHQLNDVLKKIDKEDSDEIKQLLVYDEDTAGGIMQKEIITVNKEMNRGEMIDHIRANYDDVEKLYYIFVTDKENKLIGIMEASKLLLCKSEMKA